MLGHDGQILGVNLSSRNVTRGRLAEAVAITRKDGYLPTMFTDEPLPDGPSKRQRLSKEELLSMLDDYYELREWNKKTGIPISEELRELGLGNVTKRTRETRATLEELALRLFDIAGGCFE